MATAVDWDSFESEIDDQKYYEKVLNKIDQLADDAFPIQACVPKATKITPPWFSKGLAKSSQCKKKLFTKFKSKPTPQNAKMYKDYQKHFQRIHRNAKAEYYNKQFNKYATDVKETWKILRSAIGYRKTVGQKFPDYFLEEIKRREGSNHSGGGLDGGGDGDCASAQTPSPPTSKTSASTVSSEKTRITDKNLIAEGFNEFFSTVGTNLAD